MNCCRCHCPSTPRQGPPILVSISQLPDLHPSTLKAASQLARVQQPSFLPSKNIQRVTAKYCSQPYLTLTIPTNLSKPVRHPGSKLAAHPLPAETHNSHFFFFFSLEKKKRKRFSTTLVAQFHVLSPASPLLHSDLLAALEDPCRLSLPLGFTFVYFFSPSYF